MQREWKQWETFKQFYRGLFFSFMKKRPIFGYGCCWPQGQSTSPSSPNRVPAAAPRQPPFLRTSHTVPHRTLHTCCDSSLPWPGVAGVQVFAQKQLPVSQPCAEPAVLTLAHPASVQWPYAPALWTNRGATGPALLQKASLSGCSLKIITIFHFNHPSSQKPGWLLISQIYPVPLWAFC